MAGPIARLVRGAVADSHAAMGAMGLYEPIWTDAQTLATDLSAHVLFGATVGLVHAALSPGEDG